MFKWALCLLLSYLAYLATSNRPSDDACMLGTTDNALDDFCRSCTMAGPTVAIPDQIKRSFESTCRMVGQGVQVGVEPWSAGLR